MRDQASNDKYKLQKAFYTVKCNEKVSTIVISKN